MTSRCSPPTATAPPSAHRRALRRPLVDQTRQRGRQATARRRPGPQPPTRSGRAHRPVRVPRADPGHRLVRDLRLPPRRPRQPPHRRALVPRQDRTRLRRHARQAPPHPHRRPIFSGYPRSARPQHNPRLPAGLRRSRRITAKVEVSSTVGEIGLSRRLGRMRKELSRRCTFQRC